MKKLLLLAAETELFTAQVRALLTTEGYELLPAAEPWPPLGLVSVLLVLPGPAILADPESGPLLESAAQHGLRLIPVVPELATFSFSALPWPTLKDRNAVGFMPGNGAAVLHAVRQQTGDEAPDRLKEVFISYSRRDSQPIADELYQHFWNHRYAAFLDTRQLEGGAVVQKTILSEVQRRDFVLFIDSPAARASEWVRAELVEALSHRVPVGALLVGQRSLHPLLSTSPQLAWDGASPTRQDQVLEFVSKSIGERFSLDQHCLSAAAIFSQGHRLELRQEGRRLLVLSGKRVKYLLEWEPGGLSSLW